MKNFVNFRREALGEVLREKELQGIGIGIGVAAGNYSKIIIENFGLNKLYLLDNWEGYEYVTQAKQDIFYKNILELEEQHKGLVEVIKGDSVNGVGRFEDEYFDFIYIDADHHYEVVVNDLKLWYPKLKKGGIFSGHDYTGLETDKHFGVTQAVDEFVEKLELPLFITQGTKRIPSSWYLMKP